MQDYHRLHPAPPGSFQGSRTPWFLLGNEGIRYLIAPLYIHIGTYSQFIVLFSFIYVPLKGLYRAPYSLIPH